MSTVQQEIEAYVDSVAPDQYRFFNDPVPVQRDELDRYMEDLQREALSYRGFLRSITIRSNWETPPRAFGSSWFTARKTST